MRAMTKPLPLLLVLAVLLVGSEARAQFSNRSIGIGLSYMKLQADNELIDGAIPLTLETSLYIDNGFDIYLHVPLMLMWQRAFVTANNGPGWVLGTGGNLGIRYFFSEENFRPWLGGEIAGLYIFRDSAVAGAAGMGGAGVRAGADYFVSDSVSIGAQVFFDLFITLNEPFRLSYGGGLNAAAHF
jgi:outer membrane protein